MALRRLLACLALVVCCGATGCGSDDDAAEAPALDLPALRLHTCLSLEPEHDGPCTDEALATCPSDVTPNDCLATALDQLEAVESGQFGSSTVESDDPPTLLIVVIIGPLTVALLAGLAWRTSRRTSQADEAELASALPALEQAGFETLDPADVLSLPVAVRGKVVHLLRHPGPAPVWLIETSNRTLGVNELGVLRQALLQPQAPLPAGRMAPIPDAHHRYDGELVSDPMASGLEHALNAHFPHVGLQSDGSIVAVTVINPVRVVRGTRSPVTLDQLATIALQIAEALTPDE